MHKMSKPAKQPETVLSVIQDYVEKRERLAANGVTDKRITFGAWKRARNKLEKLGLSRAEANDKIQSL